ncbi:MAG: radical SAM protein [Candidatus Bathyarchaeota archaeon]
MFKVLIANPPAYIRNYDRHFVQAGSRWSFSMNIPKSADCKDHYLPYPFFIGYASALLKRDSEVEVKTVDGCALDFDEKDFQSYVRSYSPDVLVVEVPTISFPLVMDVLEEVEKSVGYIVVAGSHVSALPKEVMTQYPFIDYCLIGEYELTLKELIGLLATGKTENEYLKTVEGLVFRRGDEIVVSERRKLLSDLDYLPFPDRDDLPIEHYHDFEIAGKPCAQIFTTRGCPSGCIFCLFRQVVYASPRYRKRSPSKVIDEMTIVKEKYGAKQVYFDDDTMAADSRHMRALCQEILDRRLDIPWTCMGDITLNYETLSLMVKAGCVGVKFGVESMNMKTLQDIKKSFINLEKVEQFTRWCKKLRMWTHSTYAIGLPGETKDDVTKTINFAMKLKTDSAQFSMATPLPGTPFFKMAKEKGWLVTDDWTRYDGSSYAVVSYPKLTNTDIEQLHQKALKQFYKRAIVRAAVSPRKVINLARAKGLGYAVRKVKDIF